MQLIRGVIPRPCAKSHSLDEQIRDIIQSALQEKLIEVGERVVITAGLPLHTAGTTNTLKVLRVDDTYLQK
jgi:pyruvate kinase